MLAIKAHGKAIRHQMRMLAWTQANIISAWMPRGRSVKTNDLLGIRTPSTAEEVKEYMAKRAAAEEDDD